MIGQEFQTVFDITHRGFVTWKDGLFGLIFVGAGVLLMLLDRLGIPFGGSFWEKNPILSKLFNWFFVAFGLIFTLMSLHGSFSEYSKLKNALIDHTAIITLGTVDNFVPMPYEGHKNESFSVGDQRFSYSDYIATNAFNQSASHGGPIRAGQLVRITHVNNAIVRLEIAK